MITDFMSADNLATAQDEVHSVVSTGRLIQIKKPETSDEFGETITESIEGFNAYPIRFTPFDRNVLQKISWAPQADVICYISKKSINLKSMTIEDVRSYKSLVIEGKKYELNHVEEYKNFGTDFLYVLLGGKLEG